MHHMNGPARGHGGRNIVFTGVVLVAVGCGGLAEAQYSPNIQGGGSTLAGSTVKISGAEKISVECGKSVAAP